MVVFMSKSLPKYRYADDGLADVVSDETALRFDAPPVDGPDGKPFYPSASMTKQEFTSECDLNTIMARYTASNFDPSSLPMSARRALYGDFTDVPESYHTALTMVLDTQRSFMSLPADVRSRFNNDPQVFLDFVSNPANQQELIDLGLATPKIPSEAESIKTGVSEGISAAAAAGYLSFSDPSKKAVSVKQRRHDGGSGD